MGQHVYQALVVGFIVAVFAAPILVAVMIRQKEMTKERMQLEHDRQHTHHDTVTVDTASIDEARLSPLLLAQTLDPPLPEAVESGEFEGAKFWETHDELLEAAWAEWADGVILPDLIESNLISPPLYDAVSRTWQDPSEQNEGAVKELFTEVMPDVYSFQLFQPEAVRDIRRHLDAAAASPIPKRRPNAMNRYGLVIDKDSEGGVTYPEIDAFRDFVVDRYMRPFGRTWFNEYAGPDDDKEAYAFTIAYSADKDVKLKEHSDASLVTMNVNLNLPHEDYDGSLIAFVDEEGTKHELVFQPGMALLHRGMHRHSALPLNEGQRHNMVFWLFGENGYVRIAKYDDDERLNLEQRWTVPRAADTSDAEGDYDGNSESGGEEEEEAESNEVEEQSEDIHEDNENENEDEYGYSANTAMSNEADGDDMNEEPSKDDATDNDREEIIETSTV